MSGTYRARSAGGRSSIREVLVRRSVLVNPDRSAFVVNDRRAVSLEVPNIVLLVLPLLPRLKIEVVGQVAKEAMQLAVTRVARCPSTNRLDPVESVVLRPVAGNVASAGHGVHGNAGPPPQTASLLDDRERHLRVG